MTDITVNEYIRRRRITLAAFEMQNSKVKVIDIAMKYGYESPEAFTRAFKEIHGILPMTARKEGIQLKSYPRLTFLLSVKGDVVMDYRIDYETKDSKTAGFVEVEVPSATWAIFKTCKHTEEETSEVIQSLTKRVYTDWLPTANYEKVDGYELELYYRTDDGKCYCETWIRVLPK